MIHFVCHHQPNRTAHYESPSVTGGGSRQAAAAIHAGYRFPREVIGTAVRWYLRHGLSYRDVEELLADRGIAVDHVTVYRWVHAFTAEVIVAARQARHAPVIAGSSMRPRR
jgi:transposase-like protein